MSETRSQVKMALIVAALCGAVLIACTPPAVLKSGETLKSGGSLASPNGQYTLTMQPDGNLVESVSGTSTTLWSSGTAGAAGATATMQPDGSFVILNSSNVAVWSTPTAGHPGATLSLQSDANLVVYEGSTAVWATSTRPPSTLASGSPLKSGWYILSPNRQFKLIMQSDGDLVEYSELGNGQESRVWSSGTAGNPGASALMQPDGNLVVSSDKGVALWSTNTSGNPGATLSLQDDANIVIYRTDGSTAWVSASSDPTIAAAGDIACGASDANYNGGNGTATACRQKYTSDLLVAGGFTNVLTLGDNMQSDPSPTGFATVYGPTWGRVKAITHPEAGNHDYGYSEAKGYYGYFGAAAGDPSKGYYSYDIGTWHVLEINSNCDKITGGCTAGGAQEQWVRADLAANAGRRCTLAVFHHPRYSSGHDGNNTFMEPIFQDLYNANVDVVLSGHSHDYERFAPQDNASHLDTARGITQFVVGTGGAFFTGFGTIAANSLVHQNTTFGVLRLTLHPTGYAWRFLPEAGKSWTDSGSASCH